MYLEFMQIITIKISSNSKVNNLNFNIFNTNGKKVIKYYK